MVDSSPAAKQFASRSQQEIDKHLDALNKILLTRTYLVGERVTLADIALACTILPVFQRGLDASVRQKMANVLRWFNTVTPQPNVKKILGEVSLPGKVTKS